MDDLHPRTGSDDKGWTPRYRDGSAKGVYPLGGLRGGGNADACRKALLGTDGLDAGGLNLKPFLVMLRRGDNGYLDALVTGAGKICQLDIKDGLLSLRDGP